MTPEEIKAKELLEIFSKQTYKYQPYAGANYLVEEIGYEAGKKCALICIDEIIKSSPTNPLKGGYIEIYSDMIDEAVGYWDKVKEEISKL